MFKMYDKAVELATEHGFAVLPVRPGGKIPLIRDWVNRATGDLETIRQWFEVWPDANLGVATGSKSGVFVLDCDVDTGGLESLDNRGIDYSKTLVVRTGSGGLHIYYRYDPDRSIRNSASKIAPGLDIRGEGGFVVAPPSIHPNGNLYQWI